MAKKDQKLIEFAREAGISVSYASQITSEEPTKRRVPSVGVTASIYARTGRKFGILEGATKDECAVLVRLAKRTGIIAAPR